MQPAALTYVLQCNSCGVLGEIEKYTETYPCPKCQGEMSLFEVRLSGDDSFVDALLDQMIDSAEHGNVVSKRTLAFLADSPKEHTRASVENAWFRKKHPEYNTKHKQINNAIKSVPQKKTRQPSSQPARQISGLTRNRNAINAAELPRRTNQIQLSHDRTMSNAQNASKAVVLLPHRSFLKTILLNNNKEENMKNKIPVEVDTDYKISGSITAVLGENGTGKCVGILADLHCPDWDFNKYDKEEYVKIKISIYDEDGDLCASEAVFLKHFWKNGAVIQIPEDVIPAKVIIVMSKGYKFVNG